MNMKLLLSTILITAMVGCATPYKRSHRPHTKQHQKMVEGHGDKTAGMRIRKAVESGKMTKEEAREKMKAFREKSGSERRERRHRQ